MVSWTLGALKGIFQKSEPKANYIIEYKFDGEDRIYLLKLLNY